MKKEDTSFLIWLVMKISIAGCTGDREHRIIVFPGSEGRKIWGDECFNRPRHRNRSPYSWGEILADQLAASFGYPSPCIEHVMNLIISLLNESIQVHGQCAARRFKNNRQSNLDICKRKSPSKAHTRIADQYTASTSTKESETILCNGWL
jgi:hypothetical protein